MGFGAKPQAGFGAAAPTFPSEAQKPQAGAEPKATITAAPTPLEAARSRCENRIARGCQAKKPDNPSKYEEVLRPKVSKGRSESPLAGRWGRAQAQRANYSYKNASWIVRNWPDSPILRPAQNGRFADMVLGQADSAASQRNAASHAAGSRAALNLPAQNRFRRPAAGATAGSCFFFLPIRNVGGFHPPNP